MPVVKPTTVCFHHSITLTAGWRPLVSCEPLRHCPFNLTDRTNANTIDHSGSMRGRRSKIEKTTERASQHERGTSARATPGRNLNSRGSSRRVIKTTARRSASHDEFRPSGRRDRGDVTRVRKRFQSSRSGSKRSLSQTLIEANDGSDAVSAFVGEKKVKRNDTPGQNTVEETDGSFISAISKADADLSTVKEPGSYYRDTENVDLNALSSDHFTNSSVGYSASGCIREVGRTRPGEFTEEQVVVGMRFVVI